MLVRAKTTRVFLCARARPATGTLKVPFLFSCSVVVVYKISCVLCVYVMSVFDCSFPMPAYVD